MIQKFPKALDSEYFNMFVFYYNSFLDKNQKTINQNSKVNSTKMVYQPASTEEFNEIVKQGTVIVDFSATWCKFQFYMIINSSLKN